MDVMLIEGRYKDIQLPEIDFSLLPKKIGLFTSVQFLDILPKLQKLIEESGREVVLFNANTPHEGQILGCSIRKFQGVDAFLYLGDGRFHPTALSIENELEVYILDILSGKLSTIPDKEKEIYKRRKKVGFVKFLSSKEIGVLTTTKKGQENIKIIDVLKKKYPDKVFHSFLFDTLDFTQLENFPFIESFVNTACPRIAFDDSEKFNKKVINFLDVL